MEYKNSHSLIGGAGSSTTVLSAPVEKWSRFSDRQIFSHKFSRHRFHANQALDTFCPFEVLERFRNRIWFYEEVLNR